MTDATDIIIAEVEGAATMSPKLAERISRATKEVEAVVPDGENAFHHYHYVTIGQVRSVAGQALAAAGLALIPSIVRVTRAVRVAGKDKAGKDRLVAMTTVELTITIASPDGTFATHWVGESEDVSDKAIPKAVSAAMKGFLLSFLLVPVGEEENDGREVPAAPPDPSDEEAGSYFQQSPVHWIRDPRVKARFEAWAYTGLGLEVADVCAALGGVARIEDYPGSMVEAKAAITAWIAAQTGNDQG